MYPRSGYFLVVSILHSCVADIFEILHYANLRTCFLASGANVILTTGGIDDLCLKYFVEAGAMAVRRCKKVDLKRIAKATGATFVTSLANLEGEESFELSMVGEASEVSIFF